MTRNRSRKVFGCLLIIFSLLVFMIPTNNNAADEAQKSDFQMNGSLLVKYTGTAKTVSVPDSVKSIGQEAFADNSYITTLKLPNSLESIGYAAFSGCNNLTSVTIPDSVENIGSAAFCNCSSLKDVKIGTKVSKLGTGVFTGDSLVSTVDLSGNEKFICDDGVIYDKNKETIYEVLKGRKKTSYEMPASVSNIMPYSFYGCSNIESVTLSSYIKEIPPYAFSFCNGLKKLTIPFSVDLIDIKAFENCVNLSDVIINENVSYIADSAFDGCGKLNFIAPDNSYAARWFEKFDKSNVLNIDIIDNSTGVSGNDASSNDNKKEEAVWKTEKVDTPIPGQIGETIIVGRQAVFFIDNTVPKVSGTMSIISPGSASSTTDINTSINNNENYQIPDDWNIEDTLHSETNGKGLSLPKFAVIDGKIASKAFYGDKNLENYEFQDDITEIGDFSFARSSLTKIEIPKTVTKIGYGAFYHCDNLSYVMIPMSVTDIEPSAFANTRFLDNWLKYGDDDFYIVGDGILLAYRGNSRNVEIPETVKKIGSEVFKNHSEIEEVFISDSCLEIGEEAFKGCTNLSNISGGNNIEVIKDRAFEDCPISTVRIPENVRKIGLGAFDLNSNRLAESGKVCVFLGNTLPTASFEKTATRLSNDDYRKDSLNNVNVAIVNSESISRTGTVLDREYSGFSGLVCTIAKENDEYFNGELKIIDCTLTKEETYSFSITDTIYIYGKGYNFNTDELVSVLSMAMEGKYNPTISNADAFHISGLSENFVLSVKRAGSTLNSIEDAYKRIYGDTIPQNLTTYNISLYEEMREIPITKLGNQELPVTITLPDNVPTTTLHVICTDEDGQLEDLPYKITYEDKINVTFNIKHTGDYGIYAFNSSAVSKFNLDDTPDTGDWIHPKWFLGIGLLALGIVLLLLKKNESTI